MVGRAPTTTIETATTPAPTAASLSDAGAGHNIQKTNAGNGYVGISAAGDTRCCACYNDAFIEHVSMLIGEEGASEKLRDDKLWRGNFLIIFVYNSIIDLGGCAY